MSTYTHIKRCRSGRSRRYRSCPLTCLAMILVLLAVLGLACWLLQVRWETLLQMELPRLRAGGSALPAAVAPLPFGLSVGVVWVVIAASVITWAMRKTRSNEQERARGLKAWVRDMRKVARQDARERSIAGRRAQVERGGGSCPDWGGSRPAPGAAGCFGIVPGTDRPGGGATWPPHHQGGLGRGGL